MIELFISYSHLDEASVTSFIKNLLPLKQDRIINEWYDRKILSGDEFQENIEDELSKADIICLIISHSFLTSKACIYEKDETLKLKIKKGIRVIPIIVSPCAWLQETGLSELLAIPTDGNPISQFQTPNEGWENVLGHLKSVCNSINLIKELKIKDSFNDFLESADILTKSHSNKNSLKLDDIFVYPKLKVYDGEEISQKYDSKKLEEEISSFQKIIIAGENQSGKTTLCKKIFKIYRKQNFIPVYLGSENKLFGNIQSNIEKAFSEQYDITPFQKIDKNRVVPIIDDFHLAKHQGKVIEGLSSFKYQVLIVDDIFGLNIQNQNLIKEYSKLKIREFAPLERNDLIKKWIQIKEASLIQINQNHLQQSIDEKTENIEHSLGVVFGKGVMPSYPFFILSLLAAQDIQKPLDQDITSQGYCYQALIYLYLRKEGVKNDQIDIYSNFLTELSFWIYKNGNISLSNDELQKFLTYYNSKFNLPIASYDILKTLRNVNICGFDCLNEFNFYYSYIYYFFVAKYLSEHIVKHKKLIDKIVSNLHKDENAYITVFIAHHTKENYLLEELLLNAEILFEKYEPATLDSNEMSFFDKHEDKIIQAILPSYQHSSADEREKLLKYKSAIEEQKKDSLDDDKDEREDEDEEENSHELLKDLRLSIKTVEVMGIIIKNRSGSLDLDKLEYIYEQGLKVHLRILSSFIEIIKNEKSEIEIIEFLKERLNQKIKDKKHEIGIDKIEKYGRKIFWNINFGVIHGFITKAIHSLGSSNLLKIAETISKNEGTPSSYIVYQGINMWYGKNLRIDEITKKLKEESFSKTAENLVKHKIVEHCKLHNINYKALQKIENKLKISSKQIITERAKSR